MKTETFEFGGHTATVILPDAPNGKWVWKTEFLYAFDSAECALLEQGYTRVYYKVSNRYGSYAAVRLMKRFYDFVKEKYDLADKCALFGFSRGGLYAFNFALFYPEAVDKVYLDAPVLDLRAWPWEDSPEQAEMLSEYSLTKETLATFGGNPIENLEEYFSLGIPTLLVAGGADEVVPFSENAGRMIDFCRERGIDLPAIVKPECKHHPHSLEDVTPILDFING